MDKTIVVAIVTGIFASVITPLIKYLIDKATRKEDRAFKKEDTLSDWHKSVDSRINQVINKIDKVELSLDDCRELSKRTLKGTMLTVQHITDGNHVVLLEEYARDMESYLIDKS